MAQITGQMVLQLRQLIFYHLDNESVENANFLAGRLHAIDPRNADSSHLLALSYLRMGRHKSAYDFSQKYGLSGKNLGCAYVFALASERLGKHKDGIAALERAKTLWIGRNHWNKHSDVSRKHLPDAAMVWDVLAKLCRGDGDLKKAEECFHEAHKTNPFIWDAFQGLCDTGADVNASRAFRMTPEMAAATSANEIPNGISAAKEESNSISMQQMGNGPNVSTPNNDPFTTTSKSGEWSFQFPKIKAKGIFGSPPKGHAQPVLGTPTANGTTVDDDDVVMGGVGGNAHRLTEAPPAPARRSKTLSRLGLESSKDHARLHPPSLKTAGRSHSDNADGEEGGARHAMHKRTLSGHTTTDPASMQPRRSNRLFGQLTGAKTTSRSAAESSSLLAAKREGELRKAKATGTRGRGPSTVGRVVSGNRKVLPPSQDVKELRAPSRNSVTIPVAPQKPAAGSVVLPDTAALESLLSLFKQLGIGYSALARYDCKTSIKAFEELPVAQKETAWVLAQLGKALNETAERARAEECFARMLKIQPTRIEDTEHYSTVLWHRKKPVQLAHLAHTLRELNFEAPQTWCAIGNAFSLNGEHEQAIGCFKRAMQVDPTFTYACTLMGHELLTNGEYDSALAAFRRSVGGHPRGYASWYGLGQCYQKMGKLKKAERHYRVAANINRQNPELFVSIGMILRELGNPRDALDQFSHAVSLAPGSPHARFQRADTLMALEQYPAALTDLNELRHLVPEDADMWRNLGRCHKKLWNISEKLKCFNNSLSLDPKASQYIREEMETIDDGFDSD